MTQRIDKLIEYYGGDELAANVLLDKYLKDDENTPEDMWDRLSKEIGNVEEDEKVRDEVITEFRLLLDDFKFIPGGRIMYGVGREEKVSTTNCYVIPMKDDSIEGIYDWLRESALTYRSTGGVGTDISVLRPKGAPVKNSGGTSPGACSFMDLMSRSTHTVHQKLRRGALIITMNVHHPDILEFVNVKSTPQNVEYANISAVLTDEFMDAVENNEKYEQRWPVDSPKPKIRKKVSARKVWEEIIRNAHQHAEPGILFLDNHKRNDALAYVNPAITCNPCGENFLGPYGNCNLGHMNLAKYVDENRSFHIEQFQQDVKTAVRFLDNVIDYNKGRHALEQQEKAALDERRVGLGITGLGDCLIRLGIKYDTEHALSTIEEIMSSFRNSAYEASVELGNEKGAFPLYKPNHWRRSEFVKSWMSKNDIKPTSYDNFKMRNSFLLTAAPVGSGSIIGQVSSGIEPLFATSYNRRVKQQDGNTFKEYKTYPKIIEDLFKGDENLPDYVVTAHDIDPDYRIRMQSVIQKYIDNAISSTINLDKDVKEEVVADIYLKAWKAGIKGVTVYREGSRDGILITEPEESKEEIKTPLERPIKLKGSTYKIPYGPEQSLYITVNPCPIKPTKPYELLISSYIGTNPEIQTITVLVSALLKNVDDPDFIIDRLRRIESTAPPIWWHDKEAGRRHQINSVPRAVAIALEKFVDEAKGTQQNGTGEQLEKCPKCMRNTWVNEGGCGHCIDEKCLFEKCD